MPTDNNFGKSEIDFCHHGEKRALVSNQECILIIATIKRRFGWWRSPSYLADLEGDGIGPDLVNQLGLSASKR